MMSQTPIITHTAATPQDSPNATLDGSTRDFNNRISNALQFYSSSLSIDSIDCSVVRFTRKFSRLETDCAFKLICFIKHVLLVIAWTWRS